MFRWNTLDDWLQLWRRPSRGDFAIQVQLSDVGASHSRLHASPHHAFVNLDVSNRAICPREVHLAIEHRAAPPATTSQPKCLTHCVGNHFGTRVCRDVQFLSGLLAPSHGSVSCRNVFETVFFLVEHMVMDRSRLDSCGLSIFESKRTGIRKRTALPRRVSSFRVSDDPPDAFLLPHPAYLLYPHIETACRISKACEECTSKMGGEGLRVAW